MEKKCLGMKVKERIKQHTGSEKPSKIAAHFDKDEKVEKELTNTMSKASKLLRRLRSYE